MLIADIMELIVRFAGFLSSSVQFSRTARLFACFGVYQILQLTNLDRRASGEETPRLHGMYS